MHLLFLIFYVISKHLSNRDINIKRVCSVKNSKFNGFVFALFCILGLGQDSTVPIRCFWNELTFLSQDWYFFQKVESALEEQRGKENLQTILVIIFGPFLISSLRSELLQITLWLISSMRKLLHELPHDFWNGLRLRILRN